MVALSELRDGENVFFVPRIPKLLVGSNPFKVVGIKVNDVLDGRSGCFRG